MKILSASVELFRQYGFKAITMDDIARRAGISKKTLYQQFANKQEVVSESIAWYKCGITEQCAELIKTSANAVEAMVRTMALMDMTYKQTNPQAMFELQRYFPETFDMFRNKLMLTDIEMLKDNIQQGIDEGYYRADLNADVMARFRLEMSFMLMQPSLMVNERHDILQVSHEIFENFLYGLMTPKGEKIYNKHKEKYQNQVSK